MVGRNSTEKSKREDDDEDTRGKIKKTKSLREIEQLTSQQQLLLCESDQELDDDNGAQPIGEVRKVSNDGGYKKKHFKSFQFDEFHFQLEDAILVAPEEGKVKPSVTIIKDIFQIEGGKLKVRAQRFFRPEEAEKKEGGTWKSSDARELFYSCYFDEIPANSVMHKCVIHLVPLHKPLPDRKQHPGFIVRKFYDHVHQKVRSLIDKDCKTMWSQKQLK